MSEAKRLTTILAEENKKLKDRCEILENLAKVAFREIEFKSNGYPDRDKMRLASSFFWNRLKEITGEGDE